MPSEAELLAAATIIAEYDETCSFVTKVPCVPPGSGGPYECNCVRTARLALEAAERVREAIVFEFVSDSGTTYRCTVRGPAFAQVEEIERTATTESEK